MSKQVVGAGLIVFLVIAANAVHAAEPVTSSELPQLLPQANPLPGWERKSGPDFYHPENLFEYIDGACEQFFAYDFRQLVTANYSPSGQPEEWIAVDIYDLGLPINAFGIYSQERYPRCKLVKIGVQGILSGNRMLVFWQDRYFVRLAATLSSTKFRQALISLGQQVADRIPAKPKRPAMLALLPPRGLIPNSQAYFRRDVLGHGFLENGLTAQYRVERKQAIMLLVEGPEAQETEQDFRRLSAHYVGLGHQPKSILGLGEEAFSSPDPYDHLTVVARQGRFLVAILGLPSESQAEKLLARVLNWLGKMSKGK